MSKASKILKRELRNIKNRLNQFPYDKIHEDICKTIEEYETNNGDIGLLDVIRAEFLTNDDALDYIRNADLDMLQIRHFINDSKHAQVYRYGEGRGLLDVQIEDFEWLIGHLIETIDDVMNKSQKQDPSEM